MANTAESLKLLPKDLLELQLGQIDLLLAMYAPEDAIQIDSGSRELVARLQEWCGTGSDSDSEPDSSPPPAPPSISMTLSLEIDPSIKRALQLDISIPLKYCENELPRSPSEHPPPAKVRVRQPAWLSKADTAALTAQIPSQDDDDYDVFTTIESIKEAASTITTTTSNPSPNNPNDKDKDNRPEQQPQPQEQPEPLARVWFYFPSISTRSKREDLVRHAPRYDLTGFLVSGKPGILCVEGPPSRVDAYLRFVRTESWGDIPAHHKKVSERLRETLDDPSSSSSDADSGGRGNGSEGRGGRNFVDMRELTDEELGGAGRRGERANRTDMRALEAWLAGRGLGAVLTKVLI
ncbi:hypothetical protein F4778DRAFT_443057 [Xylariomycetidae sp. FL2044]|nr:hypothetical protein F4778DRAFT_443057 [Xylariomycetidae sp. FL2044]